MAEMMLRMQDLGFWDTMLSKNYDAFCFLQVQKKKSLKKGNVPLRIYTEPTIQIQMYLWEQIKWKGKSNSE